MAGAVVADELVGLAGGLQRQLQLVHLLRAGELVVVTEEAEQGTVQVGRAVDQWRHLEREAVGNGAGHEGPVAVDRRIDGQADSGEERVPASRAVADDADLAVGRRERPQGLDGRVGVAHEWSSGMPPASRRRRGIVGIDIEALAGVEVGAERVVAVGGEAPRDLLGRRVPARQVVDDEDPGKGTVPAGRAW